MPAHRSVLNRSPFSLPIFPGPHSPPAAGTWAGSIVSEHGRVLDTLDLPDVPTQPLVLLDFNFDGYNDIVLVGRVRAARSALALALWMRNKK